MNRIYSLVWNSRTESFVATAEKTRARGKPGGGVFGAAAAFCAMWGSLFPLHAAEVVVASGNTQVYKAPNGVQVVDIATANGAGVSHNKYTQYNVATNGLVLNNNSPLTQVGAMQSQLAGQLVPNQNLAAEARLILNEVVAANRSVLAGYTEVLGRRADVVVANPWGITCSGCGFINTDRVTLTTGTPMMGSDGSLNGFRVTQGDVLINGTGIDGRNQNILDLLARSIKIDGQMNSQDVRLVAGSNEYNYATRGATPIAGSGPAPLFAIDSSLLGGMYVNRIRLIATEAGVGVRMLGEAAASGDDFVLTAAGQIQLQGKISAARDLAVTYTGPAAGGTGAVTLSGSNGELSAQQDIALNIQNGAGATFSDGKITAGRDVSVNAGSLTDAAATAMTRFAGRNNTLVVGGAMSVDRSVWGAGGKLAMTTGSFSIGDNGATLYSGADTAAVDRSLSLIATAGNLTLGNIDLRAGASATLGGSGTSQISLGSGGSLKAGDDLNLSANDQITTAGSILVSDALSIQAADAQAGLSNSGTLQAAGLLTLGSNGHVLDIVNQASGAMLGDTLDIRAGGLNNAGAVQSTHGSTVQASAFTNSGSAAKFFVSTANGSDGVLNVTGSFTNAGLVQSAGALAVTSGTSLSNSGSLLALRTIDGGSNEALSLSAQTLNNSGLIDGGGTLSLTANSTAPGTTFENSGAIQGGGAMTLSVGNKLANTGTGKIIGDAGFNLTSSAAGFSIDNAGSLQSVGALAMGEATHLASLDNSGTVRTDATLGFLGGSLNNSGTLQAANGANLSGTTLTNTANILFSTLNGADGSATFSSAVDNQGTVQSAGGLNLTSAGTLSNSGTIKAAGSNDTLALSATTLTNSGNIDGGDLLNLTATSTSGTTFTNSGQIHSVDDLTIVTGGNVSNMSSGKLIGDDQLSITTGQSAFALSNAGRIQSGTSLTLGGTSHLIDLSNASSGVVFAGSTLALTGGTLSNAGTVQATTGATVSGTTFNNNGVSALFLLSTVAGGDGSLNFSGAVDNQGTVQSAGGLNLTSASTLSNSGTIKAVGSSDTLALSATTLTNSGNIDGGDLLNLTATSTSGTTVTNSGQIHSVDDLTVVTGGNVSNTSSGKLLGDDQLSMTTGQSAFALSNDGRIQSGASLTLGGTSHLVGLSNASSGVVFAGSTLALTGSNLDNQGKIYADAGSALDVGSLSNGSAGNSSALIFGAMSSGNSTLTASGLLDNYGAIHSSDNFTMTAPGIINRNTGGLSSLTTLTLNTTGGGSIDNYGALYAGTAMNLNATGGSVFNRAVTGTIDSSGTLSTNSANFTNNNTVVTTGNINITTTNAFVNETTLANGVSITKSLGGIENTNSYREVHRLLTEGLGYSDANIGVYEWNFDRQEQLSGISTGDLLAMTKAQIIANGASSSLNINYGSGTGRNYIAVISAPTVNISGAGTFTNEDLALYKYSYKTQLIRVEDSYISGWGTQYTRYEFWGRSSGTANYSTNVDDNHDEWGQYDPGNGWANFGRGADYSRTSGEAEGDRMAAVGHAQYWGSAISSIVTTQSFGAGIFASNFNFSGGTLNNVGSPWPNAPGNAKAGSATSGSVDARSGSGSTAAGAGDVSLSSGTSSTSGDVVTGVNAASSPSKVVIVPGTTLAFAGINLTLPSNPNGYFVPSRDPSANYLIEVNPLFAVGSNFVGSNYLAERYGFNPDTIQRRLGDSNYEAYMIRQQLIQQTGSNVLKGYGDEAAQMQSLMDQAVTQGKELGLSFGTPLTSSQIAGLSEDIVWMEEVVVAGQRVLAPRVYLAQATRDMIIGGAAIAAENINIAGEGLSNTGGTIQGSGTLTVEVKGDITNTSGSIQGGDVSLKSTEGSIVNETKTFGDGNDTSYNTTIGKTAGISATGDLAMDAKKNITVIGGDVSAEGDASLSAGGDIRFDTIVDKTTTSSVSEDSTLSLTELSSGSTSTTTSSEINIGSTLKTGGKLSLKSGGNTVIAGSDVEAVGGLDVDAGGSFRVEARQDKVTTSSTSQKSGLGVGGGLVGSESTTTENFKGSNKGSTIQVGTAEDQEKRTALLEEMRDKTKAINETTGKLLALRDAYKKAVPGSPEAKALREQFTATYATYNTQMEDAKSVQGQLAELPSADLNVKAGNEFVLQGSDLNVAGNASIDAKNGIKILDGLDEERTTTKTTTTTFLKVDGEGTSSETKAEAEANAKAEANANKKRATASASASSSAEASAETSSKHNLKLSETSTTTSVEGSRSSVASNFNVGGNLTAKTEGTLTLQGSNLNVGGDALLDAKDIEVLTGRNETYSSSTTSTTSVGFYEESNASAGASADASAGADARKRNSIVGTPSTSASASAEANSSAEASADTTLTMGVRTEQSSENSYTLTNSSSTIKVGGNLDMKAKDKATFVGANIESGGDMSIDATTIENKAAKDISVSSSSSSQTTAGLYLGGEASAEANASSNSGAQASNGVLGPNGGVEVGAEAGVSAEAEASAGIRANHQTESSTEGSTTNVVNTFKAGGNFRRTAKDTILDQGTSIEALGNIEQSAKTIKEEAIHDTTFSSSDSQSHEARLGAYAGAEASAGASGSAGGSLYKGSENSGEASADAGASAGVKASYEGNVASESESSSTAVTSRYKAGGSITSKSTESTTLIGTQFEAGKNITLEAGSLDYQSARDSTTQSSSNHDISAEGKVGLVGTPTLDASASYGGELSGEKSTTARTGSMSAGGNIQIKTTQGDAKFEGTNIKADGAVDVQSAGGVQFNAAYDTTESTNQNISAEASLSKSGKEMGVGASAGYEQENSSSRTAQTGSIQGSNITVSAKKDLTLEGTKLKSSGDTTLAAEGDVKLKAAVNSETTSSIGIGVEANAGKSDEGSSKGVSAEGSGSYGKDVTSETTSIESGGKVNIKGKNVINQEASVKSKEGTTVTGKVINEQAPDYTLSLGVEGGAQAESETKKPKEGSKTTDDLQDKRPKASDVITKKYSAEAPESSRKSDSDQPTSPKQRKAEIEKLKAGWDAQKQRSNKAIKTKKGNGVNVAKAKN